MSKPFAAISLSLLAGNQPAIENFLGITGPGVDPHAVERAYALLDGSKQLAISGVRSHFNRRESDKPSCVDAD